MLVPFCNEECDVWYFRYDFAVGYCSFYGKKVDPEPGRCRRTDGKKWRCSKDAYPDSKYCERHMHRGRNRSRKPVESQTITQSSSTVTALTATGSSGGTGSYQNLPLHAFGNTRGTTSGTNQSHYHVDSISYGIPSKDYRYNTLVSKRINYRWAIWLLVKRFCKENVFGFLSGLFSFYFA